VAKYYEEENLSFYHLENPDDWNKLLDDLKSKDIANNLPLANIRELLFRRGCETVIAEEDYIDLDYRDEFSHLYSKTFKKHHHFSKRLHFFEGKLDEQTIKDGRPSHYLGYMSLRPTLVGKVGRTIISPPFSENDRDCCLCNARFFSHVLSREFSIVGSPYIQQEAMVMSCAQASIWMAARYNTSKSPLFQNMPHYLPYDITDNACRYLGLFGRSLPSEGLTIYQMVNALINMNYSPIMYMKPDQLDDQTWNPIEMVYRYVSSKIPVIVTVPDHALTVFGYMFSTQPQAPFDGDMIVSESKWINCFILHDDQIGPYRLMPVNQEAKQNILASEDAYLLSDWCYGTADDIDGIIIPLPEKIYLHSGHIDIVVCNLLKSMLNTPFVWETILKLAKSGNEVLQEFLECLLIAEKRNPIVIGGFIIPSFKYKEYLKASSKRQGVSAEVSSFYQKMSLPHYIWVIEMSNASRVSVESDKRTILGEVILDTTANRYGPSFLALHVPGVMVSRNPHDEDINVTELLNDRAYKQYPKTLVSV
jgi:hypothetical protein